MRLTSIFVLSVLIALNAGISVSTADSCSLAPRQWSEMKIRTVRLLRNDSETIILRPRIAENPKQRAAGYQHVCPETIESSSILFVYSGLTRTSFHMSNVHADLDIGFFDDKGQLIEVLRMESVHGTNESTKFYTPSNEFMFALETRLGYFVENQLSPGNTVLRYP